jgi:hypothetical protein
MPPWGGQKTRTRKNKNDHGSAVSRKCPKFRTFLQGDRLFIFWADSLKLDPPSGFDPGSHFSQPWACKVSVRTVSING